MGVFFSLISLLRKKNTLFSSKIFCLEDELFFMHILAISFVYTARFFRYFILFSTFTVTKVAQIISHLEIVSKNIGSTLMQCRSWIWSYFLGFSWIGPILKNTTPIMIKKKITLKLGTPLLQIIQLRSWVCRLWNPLLFIITLTTHRYINEWIRVSLFIIMHISSTM